MSHAAVQLVDGVNVNRTPALNEYGISASQLIRYQYDNTTGTAAVATYGVPLVQKLGGWTRYTALQTTGIARALWAWQDTGETKHLAVVAVETAAPDASDSFQVITNGVAQTITPQFAISQASAPGAATTAGSPTVTITDTALVGVTSFDTVWIETHISVGGLVLFGLYPTIQDGSSTYQVIATDVLGNPLDAPSSSSSASVPAFTTTSGSNTVTVTLDNHGYGVASTYSLLITTTGGGVSLYGDYLVQSIVDANNFTILASTNATSGTTFSVNGGDMYLTYYFGIGAVQQGSGFGVGGFGRGGFGTGTGAVPATGAPLPFTDCTLDNFGEILIACPLGSAVSQATSGGPLFTWDPLSGAPFATVLAQGPPLSDGVFVAMPQRQIVAWGSSFTGIQDPLLLRWCDINNPGAWIGQTTNQAGEFRIPRGSRIVGCIQGPQQGLIWTDLDLWAMQYIDLPDVYGFNQIGAGCGLISRKAAASANGVVFWMGPSQFFSLTANGVQPLPCPVWDVVFQELDQANLGKIRVAVNARFNEIAWYYPTLTSGGEVAAYVKYNYAIGFWDVGALARTAWIDQSVLGAPIGADPTTLLLYQHETSNDADGQALVSSFTTGYFALSEADVKVFIDQFWPDFRWGDYGGAQSATLQVTFNVVDYAGDTPMTYGPFTMTQATQYFTPRFRGRLVSMTIGSSDVGSFWRMGKSRYRYSQAGKY